MGAQMQSGKSGRSRPMSEINVTPFVDVMLVLLIIFMVTAPLLTVGVEVDLPETTANPITTEVEPLAVSIDAQGRVFLQDTEVDLGNLVNQMEQISGRNFELRIFLRADRSVDYGTVMQVMGLLNSAGYTQIALVTEPISDQ